MKRRLAVLALSLAAMVAAANAASAGVVVPWHHAGWQAPHGVDALACPASTLCVGADASGDLLSTTNPADPRPRWQVTNVDGITALSGVSCPTASFCVASDQLGGVLTSTNPAGGAAAWTRMPVAPRGLSAVACPSASLCVATEDGFTTGGDPASPLPPATTVVWVSTDPSGGASTWQQVTLPDASLGSECGKYGGYSYCGNGLAGVACPSASLCVTIDGYGGVFTSDAPSTPAPGAWNQPSPQLGALNVNGLACATAALCLASYGGQDTNELAAWNPQRWPVTHRLLSSQARGDAGPLWCSRSSVCFLGGGSLYASSTPAAGGGGWVLVSRQPAISELSCPTIGVCLAFDSAGRLSIGSPLPSTRAVAQLLRAQLTLRGAAARLARVRRSGGFTSSFTLPSQGRLTIRWMARGHRPTLIASGTSQFTQGATRRVTLRLTRGGRALLSVRTSVSLTAEATFVAGSRMRLASSRELTLR